jgi:mono/diheme cytochrome c family protein
VEQTPSAPSVSRVIPIAAFVLLVLGVVGSAFMGGGPPAHGEPTEPLARRGMEIYRKVCQQCHNPDPRVDGTGGTVPSPAIADASLELVEGRVLRGEYPAGYKPKRDTKLMPPRTELAAEIPALHAFLAWSRQNSK